MTFWLRVMTNSLFEGRILRAATLEATIIRVVKDNADSEKNAWSTSRVRSLSFVFTPCTNFTSVFQAKRRLTSHSASEVADQSQVSGCLVTSGCCWPSAADEEW